MTHLEFSVCAHHDTLTHPEFSVRASPHGPSPIARVFSPLPGSRSALGVTSPTCPRSKAWTLRGCDPCGAVTRPGLKGLCLCACVRPGPLQPRVLSLSRFQPGVRPGACWHQAHAWAGANTHLNCFPKEITLTMGSSNYRQHSRVTERSSSFSRYRMYKHTFQSSLSIHTPETCIYI